MLGFWISQVNYPIPKSEESAYLVNLFFSDIKMAELLKRNDQEEKRSRLEEPWEFLIGAWESEEFVMKGIVAT